MLMTNTHIMISVTMIGHENINIHYFLEVRTLLYNKSFILPINYITTNF